MVTHSYHSWKKMKNKKLKTKIENKNKTEKSKNKTKKTHCEPELPLKTIKKN